MSFGPPLEVLAEHKLVTNRETCEDSMFYAIRSCAVKKDVGKQKQTNAPAWLLSDRCKLWATATVLK